MQRLQAWQSALIGAQMLFVVFGALVLVPLLTGLDASVALFTAGAGTLLFQWITGAQVPVFLASSFAFLAPIMIGTQTWGVAATMGGLLAAGAVYAAMAAVIRWRGHGWIQRLLPAVVTGPVIMVIGMVLAPVAMNMACGKSGDGAHTLFDPSEAMIVAGIAFATTVVVSLCARGVYRLLPVLGGVSSGMLAAAYFDMLDLTRIAATPWFAIPAFSTPEFHWQAILFMLPVALAPVAEHIGDMSAISAVTGKNYMRQPGLDRTLLGDGLATSLAAALGGPPNTTYSEATGAVALTKTFDPRIMTWAAIFAIALSFFGKLGAVLGAIPLPVMGGILVLLFGAIIAVGINTLIIARTDLSQPRQLTIVAVTISVGIGGLALPMGEVQLTGIGLAALVAIGMNLVLPVGKTEKALS